MNMDSSTQVLMMLAAAAVLYMLFNGGCNARTGTTSGIGAKKRCYNQAHLVCQKKYGISLDGDVVPCNDYLRQACDEIYDQHHDEWPTRNIRSILRDLV